MKIINLINKHSRTIMLAMLLSTTLITPAQSNATPVTQYQSSSDASIPAVVWLFGSGLIGMIGVSRQNKNHNIRSYK